MEVLQAVNLLLAFPLFVVIVGVDARWLIRSIQNHYQQVLGTPHGEDGAHWASTPQNYLEKIFQLSLNLPPLSDAGYRKLLVDGLLAEDGDDEGPDDAEHSEAGDATDGPPVDPDTLDNQPNVSLAAEQPELKPRLIQMVDLPSRGLTVGFTQTGLHVITVVSGGSVMCWDTHRRADTCRQLRLLEPGLAAAVAPNGRVLVVRPTGASLIDGVDLSVIAEVHLGRALDGVPTVVGLQADGTEDVNLFGADGSGIR